MEALNTEFEEQYYGNQVHGGVVVSERVRAIFQAIDFGLDGYSQVQSALKCLPKKDYENIREEIEQLERKRIYDIKHCLTVSHRKTHNQEFALNVAGAIVTYLDSIGQWWYKKQDLEGHKLSPYELS